jgi:hypothetical protein
MLTGQLHLHGLEERMAAHKTHTVVSFDTVDYKNYPHSKPKEITAAHRLEFKGDARLLSVDTFLKLGLGSEEVNMFISWAENNGKLQTLRYLNRNTAPTKS